MKTTSSFTQAVMAPNSDVGVFVDSADGLAEGQVILIAGGGYYVVQSILVDPRGIAVGYSPGT